jgi:hypothetical protein
MDTSKISEAIERAAKEAAYAILPKLKQAVIEQVEAELQPIVAAMPPTGAETTDLLRQAVVGLQESTNQTEILVALLDGAERFSGRCGLLIVRGALAVGWQAHGFNGDLFKRVQVDCSRGVVERAIQSRSMATGSVTDIDASFGTRFGAPSDGNCVILPLCVRDRVAAVLYGDCGEGDPAALDVSALDILVRMTSLWLEALAARHAPQTAPQQVTPTPAVVPQAVAPVVEVAPPTPVEVALAKVEPVAPPPPPPVAAPIVDDEVRNKARRFAKLLVEEIKLYNQAKVVEGRANRDLYSRLREDIEKSRAAYRKRFGEYITDTDYFSSELVRVLADSDPSLLGPNFSG